MPDKTGKTDGPFRIAMLHVDLPTTSRGGVAWQVHYLSNALARRGHEVTVFGLDDPPANALYGACKVSLPERVYRSRLLRLYLFSLFAAGQDYSGYDLIHAHGDNHFFFTRNIPLLRTFNGTALNEALTSTSLKRALVQFSLYPLEILSAITSDRAVGISRATNRYLPFVREVVCCGVDQTLFHPGEKSEQPSILFVGTLHGRKRGDLLVEAFNRLVRPAVPQAELWMVCDEETAGEGIKWYGRVSSQVLAGLYRSAWVFCLPSRYEGFGVPYIESMASGTPAVATYNPGACEVLGRNRWGIVSRDAALGETLTGLLIDKAKRRRLAESGLKRAAFFSWDRTAERYERIYSQMVKGEKR
ncbi:MAG: glycosyltransferase family 4 protein [bacterium]|nr:glycosyltransferase family 4 protein [bacterium]